MKTLVSPLILLLRVLRSALRSRNDLMLDNLALRQQLAILKRESPRPRLRPLDRFLLVWLRRIWPNWRGSLAIVTQTYKWDAFNRLRKVYDDQSSLIVTYSYGPGSRRIRKNHNTGNDTDYFYATCQVLEERNSSTGNLIREFVDGDFINEHLTMDERERDERDDRQPGLQRLLVQARDSA